MVPTTLGRFGGVEAMIVVERGGQVQAVIMVEAMERVHHGVVHIVESFKGADGRPTARQGGEGAVERRHAAVGVDRPGDLVKPLVRRVANDGLGVVARQEGPFLLGEMPLLNLGGQALIPLSVSEGECLAGGRRCLPQPQAARVLEIA